MDVGQAAKRLQQAASSCSGSDVELTSAFPRPAQRLESDERQREKHERSRRGPNSRECHLAVDARPLHLLIADAPTPAYIDWRTHIQEMAAVDFTTQGHMIWEGAVDPQQVTGLFRTRTHRQTECEVSRRSLTGDGRRFMPVLVVAV